MLTVIVLLSSSCRTGQGQILLVSQGNLVSEDAELAKEVNETVSDSPRMLQPRCDLCPDSIASQRLTILHHSHVYMYIRSISIRIMVRVEVVFKCTGNIAQDVTNRCKPPCVL